LFRKNLSTLNGRFALEKQELFTIVGYGLNLILVKRKKRDEHIYFGLSGWNIETEGKDLERSSQRLRIQ
jgi:hypothetical protein